MFFAGGASCRGCRNCVIIKSNYKMDSIPKFIEPDLLADNCYYRIEEEVKHVFTEQELSEKKHNLFQIYDYRRKRLSILSTVSALLKEQYTEEDVIGEIRKLELEGIGDKGIKQLTKDLDAEHMSVSQGYEIRRQMVYGFGHQELGKMAIYGEDGHLIYERPLRPNERQTKITLSLIHISEPTRPY